MVSALGLTLLVLGLGRFGVMPAWRAHQQGPVQVEVLKAQLETMRAQALEVEALRTTVQNSSADLVGPGGAADVDDETVMALGAAMGIDSKLERQGKRMAITVNGASSEQLRSVLTLLRARGLSRITEAELVPGPDGIRGRLLMEPGN